MPKGIYKRTEEVRRRFIKNLIPFSKGHKTSKEILEKAILARKDIMPKGKNHYHWKGGLCSIKRNCLICGKEFITEQSFINRGLGKFCSYKCANSRFKNKKSCNYKGIIYKCKDCGIIIHRGSTRCCSCWIKFWKENYSGEKSFLWVNGSSYKDYPKEFNKTLKDFIRRRDNWKCQLCQAPQEEFEKKLICHHIDYDKKNNKWDNLITLCRSCHTKTNHNREYWKQYFSKKQEGQNAIVI